MYQGTTVSTKFVSVHSS